MRTSTFASRPRLTPLAVVAVCAALGSSPVAFGDAFSDARKTFDEAESLYKQGEYAQAADRYEVTYRMLRSPLLFFNMGQARRKQFEKDGDYRNLVKAREHYEQFLAEAEPDRQQKKLAEANLQEVEAVSLAEAKKRFITAQEAYGTSRYLEAIEHYDASYALSKAPEILFNIAQAERKQFQQDGRLERLSRAEDMIVTYRDTARAKIDAATLEKIESIISELRTQRAEYYRRRDAEARTKEPDAMREARDRYQQGDGPGALDAIERAEKTKGNPRVVLLAIYRLRAQAAVMSGNADLAAEAFKHYLAIEPAADDTDLSEEAKPAFVAAKEFWKGKAPLKIEHLPPGKVAPRKPVTIPIKVASDPLQMVRSRVLHYRQQGFKQWNTIKLQPSEDSARLPATPLPLVGKAYRMEYYVVALDENSAVLDSLGTSSAPLAFLVTKDAIVRPTPVYKRWWVWAAAGAVVAGSIATYAIVTNDGLPDSPTVGDL